MPEPADVQVEIDDRVMLARPDFRCVVVLATGMANAESDEESSALLADAEQQLRGRGLARASDDPHIAAWRSAFSGFGAKPSKYPSSAEALAARVLKGGALPRINVLVDLYRRGCMARRRRRDLPPLELAPGHPHPPHRGLVQRVLRLRSA